MSTFVPNKVYLRGILWHYFIQNKSAAEFLLRVMVTILCRIRHAETSFDASKIVIFKLVVFVAFVIYVLLLMFYFSSFPSLLTVPPPSRLFFLTLFYFHVYFLYVYFLDTLLLGWIPWVLLHILLPDNLMFSDLRDIVHFFFSPYPSSVYLPPLSSHI